MSVHMKNNLKQKTIGVNPLDDYLSFNSNSQENNIDNEVQELVTENIEKQRITLHISASLINKIKNVVYWEPGMTIASFAQNALEEAIEKAEQAKGGIYPERRSHNLRGGRPIK